MTRAMTLGQKVRRVPKSEKGKLVTESKRIYEHHKIVDKMAWGKAWFWLTW